MPVPITYRRSSEAAIASYSYSDIAEGTGIVIYYGFTHQETTTEAYSLQVNTIYPQNPYTTVTTISGDPADTPVKSQDIDLDLVFNKPQRIKGKARFSICHGNGHATDANKYSQQYLIVKVRKYSGTTETEIANAQGKTNQGVNQQIKYFIDDIEVDIANVAHFKKGDRLRITIEIWILNSPVVSASVPTYLLHDPMNRTDATTIPQDEGGAPVTSQLKAYIPYVIDL